MIGAGYLVARVSRKAARIARQPLLVVQALRQTLAYYGSPRLVASKAAIAAPTLARKALARILTIWNHPSAGYELRIRRVFPSMPSDGVLLHH